MNYKNFIYIFNTKFAYVLLGVLAATLAGSLGYLIWLLLKRKTAKFYIKNAMRFLKLILACYLVPIIPFICFVIHKESDYWSFTVLVTLPITVCLSVLTFLWLMQLVIVAVYHYIHYIEKCEMYKNSVEIQKEEICAVLEKWKNRLGIKRKVGLYANNDISSPNIIYEKGYQILLPTEIMEPKDYDIVILHELMHLKRRDLFVKDIGFVVNVIHAFNPLVCRLRKQLEKWTEVGCDFDCCEFAREEISRQDYFNCMIQLKKRSQDRKYADGICCFAENQQLIGFRVDMMHKMKGESLKVPAWTFLLTLFLMFAITGGTMVLTTDAAEMWCESSLGEVEELHPESTTEKGKEDILAGSNMVYSDINVLNQANSTDFTLNPEETWIFDITEENADAVFVSIRGGNKDYRIGCIGTEDQVIYVDGKVNQAEDMELEQGTIQQIFVQSLSDDSLDIEMIVMKKQD